MMRTSDGLSSRHSADIKIDQLECRLQAHLSRLRRARRSNGIIVAVPIAYVLWPANIEQRRTSTVLLAIEYNALRVPHIELNCRFSRSDPRL